VPQLRVRTNLALPLTEKQKAIDLSPDISEPVNSASIMIKEKNSRILRTPPGK
jgi:hypothetical protein